MTATSALKRRHCGAARTGMAMPFGASGFHEALENERDQLIERVDSLQAHKDQRCDHQVKAEMHEELAIK
jgi:hypothetical protein